MIGRHVKSPKHFFDFEALTISGREKGGDTVAVTGLTTGSGEN